MSPVSYWPKAISKFAALKSEAIKIPAPAPTVLVKENEYFVQVDVAVKSELNANVPSPNNLNLLPPPLDFTKKETVTKPPKGASWNMPLITPPVNVTLQAVLPPFGSVAVVVTFVALEVCHAALL